MGGDLLLVLYDDVGGQGPSFCVIRSCSFDKTPSLLVYISFYSKARSARNIEVEARMSDVRTIIVRFTTMRQ